MAGVVAAAVAVASRVEHDMAMAMHRLSARYSGQRPSLAAPPPSRALRASHPISSPRAPIGRRVPSCFSPPFATKAYSCRNPLTRPESRPFAPTGPSPPPTACIPSHRQSIATGDRHRRTDYQAAAARHTHTHDSAVSLAAPRSTCKSACVCRSACLSTCERRREKEGESQQEKERPARLGRTCLARRPRPVAPSSSACRWLTDDRPTD